MVLAPAPYIKTIELQNFLEFFFVSWSRKMPKFCFEDLLYDNYLCFMQNLQPYEFNIRASGVSNTISLNVSVEEDNLPHLLGLHYILPYYKGMYGVSKIQNKEISKKTVYSHVRNPFDRLHIFSRNRYFKFVPDTLAHSKPIYLYSYKRTAWFDCDYLMVKEIQEPKQKIYLHIGLKQIINSDYVINSVLVMDSGMKNYDMYFSGQPRYNIHEITKTNKQLLDSETTYLERDEIRYRLEVKALELSDAQITPTSKLVKNWERLERKLDTRIKPEEFEKIRSSAHQYDARTRHLIKEIQNQLQ